jgi:hypothetical protein
MSSEQGPRGAGMRPSAIAAGRRRRGHNVMTNSSEGGGMSSEQGPRGAGMRPSAIAAGRRRRGHNVMTNSSEAAA